MAFSLTQGALDASRIQTKGCREQRPEMKEDDAREYIIRVIALHGGVSGWLQIPRESTDE